MPVLDGLFCRWHVLSISLSKVVNNCVKNFAKRAILTYIGRNLQIYSTYMNPECRSFKLTFSENKNGKKDYKLGRYISGLQCIPYYTKSQVKKALVIFLISPFSNSLKTHLNFKILEVFFCITGFLYTNIYSPKV